MIPALFTLVPALGFLHAALAVAGDACTPLVQQFVGLAGTNGSVLTADVVSLDGVDTLLIGGQFTGVNGGVIPTVARWDGANWQPMKGFTWNLSSRVRGFLTADVGDGPQLLAFGDALIDESGSSFRGIARWSGTTWEPLPIPFPVSSNVESAVVADVGNGPELFVGGLFTVSLGGQTGKNLARLTADGWAPVLGEWPPIWSLAAYDDGKGPALYIGSSGGTLQPQGISVTTLARYDGTTVTALGTPSLARVDTLSVCVVAGLPRLVGGTNQVDPLIADLFVWDGQALTVTQLPVTDSDVHSIRQDPHVADRLLVAARSLLSWDGVSRPKVLLDLESLGLDVISNVAPFGNEYLIAGDFYAPTARGTICNLALFDGVGARPFVVDGQPRGGLLGPKESILVIDDGEGQKLYVGGELWSSDPEPYSPVAVFDSGAPSGEPPWKQLGDSGRAHVLDMVVSLPDAKGDSAGKLALYATSNPEKFAGSPSNGTVWRWDGVTWQHVGPTPYLNGKVLTLADLGQGERVFCGGTKVQQFANGAWTSLPLGSNLDVRDMLTMSDGTETSIVVAGKFSVGAIKNIVTWNGSTSNTLGGGMNQTVDALELHDAGDGVRLYAGGAFTTAGGVPAQRLASWNGSSWTPVLPGIDNSTITALHSWTAGTRPLLLVGGGFDSVNLESTYGIAVWDGVSWAIPDLALSQLDASDADILIRSIATFDFGNGAEAVLVGGFSVANDTFSPGMVTFNPELLPSLKANITSRAMPAGTTAVLTVELGESAAGSSVQWTRNGVPLVDDPPFVDGSTTTALTLASLVPADAGSYRALVENGCGKTIAGPATLTVLKMGDITGDGVADSTDVAALFGLWGTCEAPCAGDFNSDGVVDGADLALLLASWG